MANFHQSVNSVQLNNEKLEIEIDNLSPISEGELLEIKKIEKRKLKSDTGISEFKFNHRWIFYWTYILGIAFAAAIFGDKLMHFFGYYEKLAETKDSLVFVNNDLTIVKDSLRDVKLDLLLTGDTLSIVTIALDSCNRKLDTTKNQVIDLAITVEKKKSEIDKCKKQIVSTKSELQLVKSDVMLIKEERD